MQYDDKRIKFQSPAINSRNLIESGRGSNELKVNLTCPSGNFIADHLPGLR